MIDWFRSWHGAPTDPKWLGIAKRADVAPGIAAAVAWALMDRASQASDRGSIAGYDADGLACFFGCEAPQVDAIVHAMRDKGMLEGDRFAAWERRQPKREDDSAQRVKQHRKRNVTQRNAREALPSVSVSPSVEGSQNSVSEKGTSARASEARQELETVLDAEHASAVIDHRKQIRKPLTPHAARLLAGKFAQTSDPNAAADAMIANGWQGFDPAWIENRTSTGPPQQRQRTQNGYAAHFLDLASEPHDQQPSDDRPDHHAPARS